MSDLSDDLRSNDVEAIYDAIIDAGKQGRRDLRGEIEPYLTSPDAGLREAALKTLAFYWHLPEHEATAMRALRGERDRDVRAAAAMALADYATRSREALWVLLDAALDEQEDEGVRDMAYSSALIGAGVSKAEYPMGRTTPGFERRADWGLLARLLEARHVALPARLSELVRARRNVDVS